MSGLGGRIANAPVAGITRPEADFQPASKAGKQENRILPIEERRSVQNRRSFTSAGRIQRVYPLHAGVGTVRPHTDFAILEKGSLLLLFAGAGVQWCLGYWACLLPPDVVPDWFLKRSSLLIGLPALLCGLRYYWSHATFVRSMPLILCALIFLAGIGWASPTERGRGLLLFAALATTLPIAALIVKSNNLDVCMRAFVWATAASLAWALMQPGAFGGSRFGYMMVEMVGNRSNPNGVGLQALLAIIMVCECYFGAGEIGHRLNRSYRKLPLVGIGLILFFLLIIAFSASRSALVTLLAVGMAQGFTLYGRVGRGLLALFYFGFLYIILAVMFALPLGPLAVPLERFQNETFATAGSRISIWEAAFETVKQDPRTLARGVGSGAVDKELATLHSKDAVEGAGDGVWRVHSHNGYLEWVVSLGLLGSIPGFWLLVHMIQTGYSLDKERKSVFRRSLLTFVLVFSMSGVIYMCEFWLALGSALWAVLSKDFRGNMD